MLPRSGAGAAALALAIAIAGCQLDLEGAACEVPGATEQCPDGQACGNDLRCSTRAAACAAARCDLGARRCDGGDVQVCTDGDAACGRWSVEIDCPEGTACAAAGPDLAALACACPSAAVDRIVVDAAAPGDPTIGPTGAESPALCRFPSLVDGLAEAARRGAGAAVIAIGGAAATYPIPSPLRIPAEVAVRGEPVTGTDRPVLALAGGGDAVAGVELEAGATLAGFRVRSEGTVGPAVRVVCGGGTGEARVEDVAVEPGAGALRIGVEVAGDCPASLARVTVHGASQAGIEVARPASAAQAVTEVVESEVRQSGVGVRLTSGDLRVTDSLVTQCGIAGVEAGIPLDGSGGSGGPTRLTLAGSLVNWNGGTGVVIRGAASAPVERAHLLGNQICANAASTLHPFPSLLARPAGGLYVGGNPPAGADAVRVRKNAIHANGGDQVLVIAAGAPWRLDGAIGAVDAVDCAADANIFTGYDAGAVGLFARAATVSATGNVWKGVIPSVGSDYDADQLGKVGAVSPPCVPSPPPSCPDP